MILHKPSGMKFLNRKEAKEALNIGTEKYKAKMKDGELIRLSSTILQAHGYESANTK